MKNHFPVQDWKQFEAGNVPSSLELDEAFFRAVPAGARVLDIGSGSGSSLRALQERGYRATGMDINRRALVPAAAPSAAADARQQPFRSQAFDACIMQAFMTTLTGPEQRSRALAEAARVLRPEGLLYLAVFGQTPENPVYRERYRRGAEETGEAGTFAVTRDGTPDTEVLYRAHHYSEQELRELLSEHFEVIYFQRKNIKSYHVHRVNGFIVLARLNSGAGC